MSTPTVDDPDLFLAWLHALSADEPDIVLVASLEDTAGERGWSLTAALDVLLARVPGANPAAIRNAVRDWSPDLHPRGKDGKFISTGGSVKLSGKGPNGVKLDGLRGVVQGIDPDPKTPGRPNIRVGLFDPDKPGRPARTISVKPDQITEDASKARLDAPDAPNLSRQTDARGDLEPNAPKAPAAPAPALPKRALPGQDVEPRPRPSIDAQRAALTKKVNDQAANLSTTDADERAAGLEEIFANLRFSIIDTDQVHDRISPPDDESGRWTPERHAQHEEMWENLLSQVKAAGIPKDRDAMVLGGLPGAGKTYSLRPGQKADGFGVTAWEPTEPVPEGGATHVSINPDIIKEMLISRGMVPDGLDNLKPMEKVNFIHEESSMLGKMFSARLAEEGYNIVLDNTMDSSPAMLKRMTPLAEKDYKFRALFVDIPVEESLISASKRYKDAALTPQGGRYVPSSVQANRNSTKGTLSKNRDAMDELVGKDWFTQYMVIDNSGISERKPLGEVTAQGTGTGSAAVKYAEAAKESLAGRADAATAPSVPTAPSAPTAPLI
jgi:hypothetical protein